MKYLTYPGYKDSGVEWLGEVPEHWDAWKIAHCYPGIGSGTTPPSIDNKWYGGNIPWVTTGELRENEIKTTEKTVTEEALVHYPTLRLYPKGSIAVAMYGATIGRLGVFGIPATTNQACCVFPSSTVHDNKFVFYWLLAYRNELVNLSSGGGQPNINQEKISKLKIPTPKKSEQTIIAQFLDRETTKIDQLIIKQQELISLLQEKRQAVISHAVTKGLNPDAPMKDSGVEWLGEVPEHWTLKRLKRIYIRVKKQGYPENEVLSVYRDYGVIKKSSRDDNNNKTPDDLSSYQLVKKGDLVINKMKAWQGSLGVSDYTGITSPDYVVYSPCHSENHGYLHYALRSGRMPAVYLSISNGIRPSQWRLEPEKFEQLFVFLPPKNEQLEIVACLNEQMEKLSTLEDKCLSSIELLKERRTALISAAVTGKIDVRNA